MDEFKNKERNTAPLLTPVLLLPNANRAYLQKNGKRRTNILDFMSLLTGAHCDALTWSVPRLASTKRIQSHGGTNPIPLPYGCVGASR